jgi:biotin operon repressor
LEREADYIPMSRVLPSGELSAVRAAFMNREAQQTEALNSQSIAKLSYILGREYQSAGTGYVRGLGLPVCTSGAPYTGFDMGAGECALIALLSRLQNMPSGGLMVIEEIEVGLHAEAQERLMDILIRECLDRKIQFIFTTHSEAILDHLPRQARVLLRRNGDEHESVGGVSTRFAVHEMGGALQPELLVYSEDRFAAVLIEEATPAALRARIQIRDVGSNTTLARQSVSHLRMEGDLRALSVFDGDCTRAQVEGWIRDERAEREDLAPAWLILPGSSANPERWLLDQLSDPEYQQELARELECSQAAAIGHIEAMRVQLDEHDAGYVLSQRTGFEQEDARRRLIRSVARRHPQLDELRTTIRQSLEGG